MLVPSFEITKQRGVRAVDTETGRALAERLAVGTSVVQLLPLNGGVIVREDYYRFPPGASNLFFFDAELREVWRAELPSAGDAYVNAVSVHAGVLRAWTWECWRCDLDPSSGRIVQKVFTK